MRTVYKFALDQRHQLPHSAKLIHAGRDPQGVLCAWFEVDTDNSSAIVDFLIVGTGHEIPSGAQHVVSTLDEPFVWHFYAVGLQ